MFVPASEVPHLLDVQLVLDVEFRRERNRYDCAAARLVTVLRPLTEAERDMLALAVQCRGRREAACLMARLSTVQ